MRGGDERLISASAPAQFVILIAFTRGARRSTGFVSFMRVVGFSRYGRIRRTPFPVKRTRCVPYRSNELC